MTAEQQLERSVLEGKERDELSAIAQAMSLKTTTRTKKADIIDQILHATGVTSGASDAAQTNGDTGGAQTNGAAKPSRRSRAAANTASADSGSGESAAASAATPTAGAEAPAAEAPAPDAPAPTEAASNGDSGPAVFVEPPELADGAVTAPSHQNGQQKQQQQQPQ